MATNGYINSLLGVKSAPTTVGATKTTTPSGVKATAPGIQTQGIVNNLATSYTAPKAVQTTQSNQGVLPGASSATSSYTPPVQQPQYQNPVQQPTQQPQTNSFGGIIGSLVNTAQNGSPQVAQSQAALAEAIKHQQELQSGIQAQYGAIEGGSQGLPIQFQQGREQVLARQYAGQEAAAQSAVTQQQAAVGQALTGQGQTLSALQGAAQLSQPQAYGLTSQPYNPLSDTYGGGGSNGALDRAQLAGQIGATQSNAQVSGTYGTNLAAQGGSAATQQYNQTNALYGSADTQSKTLTGLLDSTGINEANSSDYNKAINTLQGRLGSTNYTKFTTALTELQTMYSQLLQSGGGTPTNNDAKSLALLSPTASAAQIKAAISQLQVAANAKLVGQKSLANQYNSQLGAGGGNGAIGSDWNF